MARLQRGLNNSSCYLTLLLHFHRMKGYYKNPETTAEVFSDSWYKTGDLARVDEDGYLFIADRTKDMVITGGENVYSKEVEDAIRSHPDVAEVAVIGAPHPE